MSGQDADTLGFYATEADSYAARGQDASTDRLAPFARLLPAGGRVLELGCGGGQDSEALLRQGFDVIPTDGSPELAAQAAKRLGRPVRVLLFEDLDEQEHFDGIWANACLLHVPRAALPGILGRIHAALKPSGVFYASYKAGDGEGRDRFGRYFNYPSAAWLAELHAAWPWRDVAITQGVAGGYDGERTLWLHVLAIRQA